MPCDIGLRAWLLCHTLGDSDRCATALHNPADLKGNPMSKHNRAAQSCSTIVQVFQRPNAATVLSYGRNLTTELYVNGSMALPMATPMATPIDNPTALHIIAFARDTVSLSDARSAGWPAC